MSSIVDGRWTGPVVDQHIHLDRSNRYLSAIEEFVRVGGTGIMLVHKPGFSGSLPIDREGYREVYSETISMAEEIREKFEISVGVVLGPHPVAWERQISELGMDRASELHLESVDLALELIEQGKAHCLGEVGRPHYQVSEETWIQANENLSQIMTEAAISKVPVQLHVEDAGSETYSEISRMAMRAGLPLAQTVRHYASPDVSSNFTHGLACTVSVGRGSVEGLVSTYANASAPWGMETDFLDDPRRPGAVLGPKTIPKRTDELCSALLVENRVSDVENLLLKIHSEWPSKLYGLDF
ncbi:MAG: TatD family hydrolase [Candidatus Thermoplasmatota archaeon]|nr:TatD family hydrolase [Candidatus Thermoplasmatota archaeon]